MSVRRRSLTPAPPSAPAPTAIEVVEATTRALEDAKQQRDEAIAQARDHGEPLRAVAAAANLSVSRVKQIRPASAGPTLRPAVTEMDLFADGDPSPNAERVFSLDEVDAFLPRWPSERAFIEQDPARTSFSDVLRTVVDVSGERWSICYIEQTRELYAWTDRVPDPTYPDADSAGSGTSGPCILLGHVMTWDLVTAGIQKPGWNLAYRPGGLAWIYGRIRLLNRLLAGLVTNPWPEGPNEINTYLQSLPESERPR